LIAAGAVVGGWEVELGGDLGDNLRPAVVGVQLLERAVGIPPADAAGAEDLVQPLDDGWRLGSLDTGQLEAPAGVAAQRLRREGGLEGLDLILSQHLDTSWNGWAGLCPLVGETQKGPLPGMGTALCERDPRVHLRGDYYSILTGMHEMSCAGEKRMVMQCARDRVDQRGSHDFGEDQGQRDGTGVCEPIRGPEADGQRYHRPMPVPRRPPPELWRQY
jgi:hypothetical protein